MKALNIAIVCHNVNSAYARAIGEDEQGILPWENLPQNVRTGVQSAVETYLTNPDTTPKQLHDLWSESRKADGWVYGEVKDFDAKTHPCLVPYDELPIEQRVKDYLFKQVIDSVKHLPDQENFMAIEGEVIKLRQENLELRDSLRNSQPTFAPTQTKVGTTIQYVGNKLMYTDNAYGTGLTFTSGQARTVPADIAENFLRHPEFKLFKSGDLGEVAQPEETEEQMERREQAARGEKEREELQHDEIMQVRQMKKRELVEYANTRYNQKLSERDTVEVLQGAVIQMIEQFGVV